MTAWVKVRKKYLGDFGKSYKFPIQRGTREEVGIITDFTDPR